ncbi:MAG TPA: NUDIX domain-containing protein [Opitutaceae bacterium]|nr:NUDIX domain-containing protein [Opitutaceae bacterium]
MKIRAVETVDSQGNIGPAVPILEAHRSAKPHRAISILVWNPGRTKMLITRRAAEKATWPAFWSNAVCSHPLPEETYGAAAQRRLYEELRVVSDVSPAFQMFYGPVRCPVSGMFEHEFDQVFFAELEEAAAVDPNPAEISESRWVSQKDLAELKESGELTPWFMLILERVHWADAV